ncbi:Uncharacterised protein [Serratia plymuthica]|nr:Uncharacterised protein [Serratia plymuthica]
MTPTPSSLVAKDNKNKRVGLRERLRNPEPWVVSPDSNQRVLRLSIARGYSAPLLLGQPQLGYRRQAIADRRPVNAIPITAGARHRQAVEMPALSIAADTRDDFLVAPLFFILRGVSHSDSESIAAMDNRLI